MTEHNTLQETSGAASLSMPRPESRTADKRSGTQRFRRLAPIQRQAGLLVAIVLLVAIFASQTSAFLTSDNLINILLQGSVTAILAIGQMFVIITSGIDLSMGTMLALGAMITGTLLVRGVPIAVCVLAGIATGSIAGLINGLIITRLRITPFIVTLGTMSVFGGLAFLVTNGKILYTLPGPFLDLLAGKIATIPIPVVILFVTAVLAVLLLAYTRFGEYCVAIGGNPEVARLSGINVSAYLTGAYVLAGALSALGGMILVARLGAADPTVGTDLALPSIAAAVMGGAALRGGEGSVFGAVTGAMLIAALQAGLTLINVQAFYQQLALGFVIIAALALDRLQRRSRTT
ncbi:ABC transporter permease [Kribbella sp. NPDC050124]|uniref:ABC transporter permease n=1 Tax=Kribbella sp. NPDC050124 TaxID=3364114 RepID=UPI0037A87787